MSYSSLTFISIAIISTIAWSTPVPIVSAAAKPQITTARIEIPKIRVNADIKDMGLTPAGAMAVPGNRVEVGWFKLGTRPGDKGSAVIGGHNRWASGDGVFVRLNELQIGDTLSVIDAKGVRTSFVVREIRSYDALDTDTALIYHSDSGVHLNLITCSGDWDISTKSYTKRLVLFTDLLS